MIKPHTATAKNISDFEPVNPRVRRFAKRVAIVFGTLFLIASIIIQFASDDADKFSPLSVLVFVFVILLGYIGTGLVMYKTLDYSRFRINDDNSVTVRTRYELSWVEQTITSEQALSFAVSTRPFDKQIKGLLITIQSATVSIDLISEQQVADITAALNL